MAEMPKMEVEVELTWKRNERASARVAKIAAKVLRFGTCLGPNRRLSLEVSCDGSTDFVPGVTWAEVRALAASALTQAADKSKRNRRPK